jgi:hypothetical protein
VTFTVYEHLLVEQLEGKADDFGNHDFLLFKVRDLRLNRLLMVYKHLNGSYESPFFTSKRQLKPYLTDYTLKQIGLMKANEITGKRFREWALSMGEHYQWNSGFVSLNSNLVSNMKEGPLCKNLAAGISYLLKNNCA